MACASSSERKRRIAPTLVNALLLPELQTPQTSKLRLQHESRHGSSCPHFAGTAEPAKHNFSRKTLLPTASESLACSQSHDENGTRCSVRCGAHRPRRLHQDRRRLRPIRRRATGDRLFSELVRVVSTASRSSSRLGRAIVDVIRGSTVKAVEFGNLVAEVRGLVRLARLNNAPRLGTALTAQVRFAFQSEKEWLDRRRASIHGDAANHVRTFAFCFQN